MPKVKLLAISTSCFTATNRAFYRRLNQNNIQVELIIPESWDFGKGAVQSEPKKQNDPNITFLKPTKYHHRLFQLEGIKPLIDKLNPNVIYYEGDPGSVMAVVLGKKARQLGIRFFALSCENLSQSPLSVIKREGKRQFIQASIKYALIQLSKRYIDTLFVINDQGLSYFQKLGFKSVVKTPLGFNENVFYVDQTKRDRVRKKLKIDNDTVVISYFGRLVYEKGVHLLIKALDQIKAKNWIFLIDEFSRYKTDYQQEIENLINQSNLKNKTLFFEADHTEIADYMNASDITVLASIPTKKWVEQYGRIVPEALSCGNLLIISNHGAQNQFFNASYENKFPPNDIASLSKLIDKGVNTVLSKKYNKESHAQRAKEHFGLNAQLTVFLSVLLDNNS